MELRYGLDDRPPTGEGLLLALQWVALSLPFVILLGTVGAGVHTADPSLRTLYLQKAAFASSLMILCQAAFGHRLTLVAGSSTALLLGVVGSGAGFDATCTAAALSGLLLAALAAAGLFAPLGRLFTPRVTAAVILLLAFAMAPVIVRLLAAGNGGGGAGSLAFAGPFVASLFLAHRLLPPRGRSLLLAAGMAAGTGAHRLAFGAPPPSAGEAPLLATFLANLPRVDLDGGAILSFLFCALALSLNEAASMRSLVPLLDPPGMEGRERRGMAVTGVVNAAAGFLGTVGPVDYSLSPGVIAATGCGSRHPLVPAGAILLAASLSPALLAAAAAIPPPVVGGILVYALAGQVAAGLSAALSGGAFAYEDGLVLALPVLAGTVCAFLPPEAAAGIPPLLRPLAGNGVVVGVVAALLLDRLFRRPPARPRGASAP